MANRKPRRKAAKFLEIKRGINNDTGRSYHIRQVVRPSSESWPAPAGSYVVHLYGYASQDGWENYDVERPVSCAKQLLGGNTFTDLDEARRFAYNWMALQFS